MAYAKAGDARGAAVLGRSAPAQPHRRRAWGRWLGWGAVAFGAYAGIKHSFNRNGGGGLPSLSGKFGSSGSADELRTLAAATTSSDVVIYTTSWCPNCKAAKQWMQQQGFAFNECDVEKSSSCAAEWQALGGDGVPVLRVRGKVMKDGFDSDEFVALLR